MGSPGWGRGQVPLTYELAPSHWVGPPDDGEGQEQRDRTGALCPSCRVSGTFLSWLGKSQKRAVKAKPRPETLRLEVSLLQVTSRGPAVQRVSERAFPPHPPSSSHFQQHKAPESGQWQGCLLRPPGLGTGLGMSQHPRWRRGASMARVMSLRSPPAWAPYPWGRMRCLPDAFSEHGAWFQWTASWQLSCGGESRNVSPPTRRPRSLTERGKRSPAGGQSFRGASP